MIDRNCFEEADVSSSDDGMAHGRLERQSMLVLVPGGGFSFSCVEKSCLLWFWPTGFSFKVHITTEKSPLPCFLFPPLVANQDLILMTSLYSLCFFSSCPTHAFFIFFMHLFLAEVETQEAFGPR